MCMAVVAVIAACLHVFERYEGVRLAEPGEFTRRAFANDRMDLVEAEGLGGPASSAHAKRSDAWPYTILLAKRVRSMKTWRSELIAIAAHLEAAIDFADEDGVAEAALARCEDREPWI